MLYCMKKKIAVTLGSMTGDLQDFIDQAVTAEKLGIFNAPVIETSSKANYNVFQLFQRIADDMEPLNTGEGVDAVQFVSLSDRKPSVAEESKRSCCQSS